MPSERRAHINIKYHLVWIAAVVCLAFPRVCTADELILSVGGGEQPGSDQDNKTIGLDYSFFEFRRSERQTLSVGVSYTYLETDFGSDEDAYAISNFAVDGNTVTWDHRWTNRSDMDWCAAGQSAEV